MRSPHRAGRRRGRALAIVLATALATSACSGGDAETTTEDRGTSMTALHTPSDDTAAAATPAEAPFERYTGSDEGFYVPPDPLPTGAPGELIRVMEMGSTEGGTTVKVMYHSRDAQDRDRATTALVTYPGGEAPEGRWPVIATAPGTVGLSPRCGASRIVPEAPGWGVEGVRVMTDYIGLGVEGGPPHAYLSKASEGNAVIDAVRAARQLPEAGAGDRWLSVGHSQGGHGALAAHELAATYAPELDHVATLAIAPAAMLDRVYGGIDPIVTEVLSAMSLYGGAGEHPEIVVEDYVSPRMAEAADVFATGCLEEITNVLVPLVFEGGLFTNDPRHTEPARTLLLANDVGEVAVDAPLLLISGTLDDRVAIDRFRDLYARLCETGQVTEALEVPGADHDTIIPLTAEHTAAWLNARLAGEPVASSCALSPTTPPIAGP